jgi:transcriptional repressor NrdR
MLCPFCGATDTKVADSRTLDQDGQVRRRRICTSCQERFTTLESPVLVMPSVVKSDNRRESFRQEKLRKGIMRALEKRPIGASVVDEVVARITKRLVSQGDKEVSARVIGDRVMEELRGIDEVAYVRFASVYLSFESISAFREVVDKLEEKQ